MLPRQLFSNLKGAQHNDLPGSNICLYYGQQHLPRPDDARARMAYVDWQPGHPQIRLMLNPNRPVYAIDNRQLDFVPFTICPSLSCSFISRDIAEGFGLAIINSLPQFCDVPLFRVLYGINVQIVSELIAQAVIRINYSDCCVGVRPSPIHENRVYKFLVVDINSIPDWLRGDGAIIPERLAIIGRDILNSMLLVYRGGLPKQIEGAFARGRLYFGADTQEYDKNETSV